MTAQLKAGIKPELTRVSLVEWAETHRVIPQGLSPMPGLFSWAVTPYLEEIADNLSQTSTVKETYVMKGAQVGYSVGIGENWILYTIDQAPGPMIYVAQSQGAAERTMQKRIRPAIQQSGLGGKIFAQAKRPGSRKTGDTADMMEFVGGTLTPVGPNVGERLRSDSMQLGYFDEMDAWAQEVGTISGKRKNEGSTHGLIMRRFDAYTNTYKVLGGSTPLEASSSLIEPLYLDGDQRQYNVPCKHCGELQPLEWERLKYEKDERGLSIPESVHYECRACCGHWKNDDKVFFLKNERQGGRAKWIPLVAPRVPGRRSYHLPSLLSPIGFRDWESICLEASMIGEDTTKLQQFWNTVLGRTWTVRGKAPDYTKIMVKREGLEPTDAQPHWYDPNQWPDRALICTIGADVQADRIEAEVVAWGMFEESWSLGYHVFHGETADLNSPAWAGLHELIHSEPSGHLVNAVLVDSSYESSVVYQFCDQYVGQGVILPCMGESLQNNTRREYALTKMSGYAQRRVDIQTGQFKSTLYNYLKKSIPDEGLPPMGYCHFPASYGEKYFKMLTAEELVPERMNNGGTRYVWKPIKDRGKRNEALDCRVYAMAALHVFKDLVMGEAEEPAPWGAFWAWANGEA